MIKALSVVFIATAFLSAAVPSYCEEEVKSLSGSVVSLDWVGNKLAVSGIDPQINAYQQYVFTVPDHVSISTIGDSLDFCELEMGDSVDVYYRVESDGTMTVVRILVR